MSNTKFMNKVRQWDNQVARWMMRHFYFIFFQIVLVVFFFFWFVNLFSVIDAIQAGKVSLLEHISRTSLIYSSIIVFLLLLNSFWVLYMFNTMIRMHNTLKDISYNIGRLRRKS